MIWIKLLLLALNVANLFLQQARRAQAINEAQAETLEASIDAARKATQARNDALRDFDDRDGMPDEHDPNLRD